VRNGYRRAWRLRVHLPELGSVETAPLFQWLREFVIPACLNAPVQVTLELVPPDDVRSPEED
jgi:hypothetical protein